MGGIFVVVVVFYSVLGIRHHVLGIFLAENDLRNHNVVFTTRVHSEMRFKKNY